jgi:hypothetical protein
MFCLGLGIILGAALGIGFVQWHLIEVLEVSGNMPAIKKYLEDKSE